MPVTRRHFIKTSLAGSGFLAFAPTVPGFLARTAAAATPPTGPSRVLVVLQLTGGNDGLNTVVPFEDDIYHRKRPTLRLDAKSLQTIAPGVGFHPEMSGFLKLYRDGLLSVLQGVGYEKSSRNHPTALLDWHTGRIGETAPQLGWLGRALEQVYQPGRVDLPGAFLGDIAPPFALQTERVIVPAIRTLEQWSLSAATAGETSSHRAESDAQPAQPDELLAFVRAMHAEAAHTARKIEQTRELTGRRAGSGYPAFKLAQTLQNVAHLIRAELGIRLYFVELGGGGIGGFDTHAGQALNHGALLREFSESVTAFLLDLQRDKLLEQVLLLSFSEFGRTVSENGRRGTDHGAAAPVFLAGGEVKGGLIGRAPNLKDLDQDGVRVTLDFRRLYATVLTRWLGLDPELILGREFQPLDLLRHA